MLRRNRVVILAGMAGLLAGLLGTVIADFTWRELSDREYDAILGIERTNNTVRMTPPRSMLQVNELVSDTDEDRRFDLWTIYAFSGRPLELQYYATDLTDDEIPDSVALRIGSDDNVIAFASEDDDRDTVTDVRWFSLSDHDLSKHNFVYSDFNFDGRIDFVVEFQDEKRIREYIVDDFVFYNAQMTDKPQRIANVYTNDGKWERFQFGESGKWAPSE